MKTIPIYFILLLVFASNQNTITNNFLIEESFEKGLIKNQAIDISGLERNYHLYIPENPINAPIVMLFHGSRGSNDQLLGLNRARAKAPYKVWLDIAEHENIILIIPNGTKGNRHNGWNDCRTDAEGNPKSNDVLFISQLLDSVITKYKANASKVFAIGTSNGGHMAMRLAQEMPEKLTAFAAIAASKPVNSTCVSSSIPISALIMNGTEDPILPYEGGQMIKKRGEVYATQETIDYWVKRNQTDTTPIITDITNKDTKDNCNIKKHLYINGDNNTEVLLYKVVNGGHTEPSISQRYSRFFKRIIGEQNGDIEMANEIWAFFKTK